MGRRGRRTPAARASGPSSQATGEPVAALVGRAFASPLRLVDRFAASVPAVEALLLGDADGVDVLRRNTALHAADPPPGGFVRASAAELLDALRAAPLYAGCSLRTLSGRPVDALLDGGCAGSPARRGGGGSGGRG